MDYVMRRRSTVGDALEMFSLPLVRLPLPLPIHRIKRLAPYKGVRFSFRNTVERRAV